jgi:hypothetical protein
MAEKTEGRGPSATTVVAMVVASIALLAGVGMVLTGGAVLALDAFARDDDGYLTSPSEDFESEGFAVTAEEIDLSTDPADWAPEELLGTTRITAESADGQPLFLGVAPSVKADAYLDGVSHSELDEIQNGGPQYEERAGARKPYLPARSDIWVAQASGTGQQTLDWDAESGIWSIVVMNEDASPGVAFEAKAGVELDWLVWAGLGLLLLGVVFTVSAGIAIFFLMRHRPAKAEPVGP